MARSRRLGIAGEVSVWQIPENSVKSGPCHQGKPCAQEFVLKNFGPRISWQQFGRAFSLWKKRSMIDFPIRSCCARISGQDFPIRSYNIKVGPMTFPGWDGADWVLSTQRSRIRGDWILSTQRLPIHWSLRDSLGDDIAFFTPDANKISSPFSCRFFLR